MNSVVVQADGKILVGGKFKTVNKIPSNNLVRLLPGGKVGIAFSTNLGTGFDAEVFSVAVQGDGKILAGGYFLTVNGISSKGLARLNAGGNVDIAFSASLGINVGINLAAVYSIVVQEDGKIVVGGYFYSYPNLARLNADGTVDTAFIASLGTGFDGIVQSFGGSVISLAVQGDGKILVGGTFETVNGIYSNQLARLNADGTVDTEFSANFNMNKREKSESISLAVQTDGKILIASTDLPYLLRLNSDGTVDTEFSVRLGTGNGFFDVISVAVQADGKILMGGVIIYYQTQTQKTYYYFFPVNEVSYD